MVVCPSCGSSRIRNGYKPAPFLLRVVGMRSLLCDSCNFPFRAFSPLPPKSRRPHHVQRKADVFNPAPEVDLSQIRQQPTVKQEQLDEKDFPLKKLELKLTAEPVEAFEFATSIPPTPVISPAPASARIITDYIAPVRNDLRTEITKIHTPGDKKSASRSAQTPDPQAHDKSVSSQNCPECNSHHVRRRRRNAVERTLLSFSEHKAYSCRDCGASFYAKSEERETRRRSSSKPDTTTIESTRFQVEQKG